jgi:hypothetical protein
MFNRSFFMCALLISLSACAPTLLPRERSYTYTFTLGDGTTVEVFCPLATGGARTPSSWPIIQPRGVQRPPCYICE